MSSSQRQLGNPRIRPCRSGDLPALRELEIHAGEPFREIGMQLVADDPPPTEAELAEFQRDGRAWVAGEDPIGYLLVQLVDGNAHIHQVSVHPRWARRGIGRTLIDRAAEWGREAGVSALTLTTFVEVPWNGPYYRRLGFSYLDPAQETPGLRALREEERRLGLDSWPRACMRRSL